MKLFDEYASWTDTTAKYPPEAEPFYLALGIADEAGELAEALPGPDRLKEGGDVLWYAARYAVKVLGVPFSDVVRDSLDLAFPRSATPYVGTICGVEKKRIRDGANWDEAKRDEKMSAAYSSLVYVIAWVNGELTAAGFTLEQAAEANMGKLNKRLADGTIQGDGDNR